MKDDKDEKRLEQSRLVLQKFGLLPPNFDLHGEFLRLMGEQVAAYYDPKTKSVNLLDWVQPDAQKPILAHELTHALQDQKVGVEKWELAGAKDDTPLPDQQEYVVEEEQSARQCVTEGQGMAVMFDYSLAPFGKSLLTAPEVVAAMRATMGDSKDSPVFSAAPMFLKESMLMPYTFGLDFVRTVLANKGKAAYAMMLENPPIDTRQIMQPETYLLHQQVAPLTIPDLDKIVAPDYKRFDFGGMGEFDIYLLAKQYGAEDTPNYYRHWRGGYYFAAQAKNAPKDQIAMLFFTHWDSPQGGIRLRQALRRLLAQAISRQDRLDCILLRSFKWDCLNAFKQRCPTVVKRRGPATRLQRLVRQDERRPVRHRAQWERSADHGRLRSQSHRERARRALLSHDAAGANRPRAAIDHACVALSRCRNFDLRQLAADIARPANRRKHVGKEQCRSRARHPRRNRASARLREQS